MVRLYEARGDEIFEQSLWRELRTVAGIFAEAYAHEALEIVLNKYLGAPPLADCGVPTMVTSYEIQNRRTVFLKSWQVKHADVSCREAARDTSAAPTYFDPAAVEWAEDSGTLVDGSVFMNSTSVSAFTEARTRSNVLWVMSLLDRMFDGVSKAADYQMRVFLGDNYLRLQTPLHFANDDMDDASKGNIRNPKQTARELIARQEGSLHRFLAPCQSATEKV